MTAPISDLYTTSLRRLADIHPIQWRLGRRRRVRNRMPRSYALQLSSSARGGGCLYDDDAAGGLRTCRRLSIAPSVRCQRFDRLVHSAGQNRPRVVFALRITRADDHVTGCGVGDRFRGPTTGVQVIGADSDYHRIDARCLWRYACIDSNHIST